MGTVYLARSAGGRTVALKTMHAGIAADPAARTRFHLETDAARIIGGHHGATVVEADPRAVTPWLATEYVLGPPLDEAVALCGPLPETSVRAVGAALAGALAQLHASDVVHRDLKPSNVMITAHGPKIIDFGIARAAGDDRLTRTGAAAGTPAFMSPEQATGQEHTPAGDVFALAGVLIFAAAGHGPFGSGQPADLLYRVRYADPDLSGVPNDLVPVLGRCLAKDPSQRPTTAQLVAELHDGRGEFADHLPARLLGDIGRRASEVWQYQPYRLPAPEEGPYTAPTPARPGMSRRTLLSLAGGSLVGVGAAGAGAWAWFGGQRSDDTSDAKPPARSGPPELWRAARGVTYGERPLLLPVGDNIVTWRDSTLVARSATNGKELWSSHGVVFQSHQFTSDGTMLYGTYFPDEGGKTLSVHAFTLFDGTPHRRVARIPGFVPFYEDSVALIAARGVLCMAARKNVPGHDTTLKQADDWFVLAIDIRSGRKLWERSVRQVNPSDRGYAVRAVGNLLVFFRYEREDPDPNATSSDMRVFAVDLRTGQQAWNTYLPWTHDYDKQDVHDHLAVDARHVYVAGRHVWALRLSDGEVAWRFGDNRNVIHDAESNWRYGPPTVKNGVVYAAEGIRGLVALDAVTGGLLWEEQEDLTKNETPDLQHPPVVGTKYVYAKVSTGISAIHLRSHKSAWVYESSPIQFLAHEASGRLIYADASDMTALPLE
ncbi:protein kinase domain-containing protein [Streptomyces ficellus]